MYNFLRGILAILIISPLIWQAIKHWKEKEKRRRHILISGLAFMTAFIAVGWFGPVENLFYRWKTPEDAFRYMYLEKWIVDTIKYGDQAYVYHFSLLEGTHKTGGQFLKKDEKGWKISSPGMDKYQFRAIVMITSEGTSVVTVRKPYNQETSILSISSPIIEKEKSDGIQAIYDNTQQEFMVLEAPGSGEKKDIFYLKPVKIDRHYSLTVGEYVISSEMLNDFSKTHEILHDIQ